MVFPLKPPFSYGFPMVFPLKPSFSYGFRFFLGFPRCRRLQRQARHDLQQSHAGRRLLEARDAGHRSGAAAKLRDPGAQEQLERNMTG